MAVSPQEMVHMFRKNKEDKRGGEEGEGEVKEEEEEGGKRKLVFQVGKRNHIHTGGGDEDTEGESVLIGDEEPPVSFILTDPLSTSSLPTPPKSSHKTTSLKTA